MTNIFYITRDNCFGAKYYQDNKWKTKYIPARIITRDEATEWITAWLKEHNIAEPRPYTPPRHSAHAQAIQIWKSGYSDGCDFSTFMVLSQEPCHYCAAKPSNNKKGNFQYNGLDRLDSNKDHSPENVVPCCKHCNYAKRDMSYEAFIALIQAINNNLCKQV